MRNLLDIKYVNNNKKTIMLRFNIKEICVSYYSPLSYLL